MGNIIGDYCVLFSTMGILGYVSLLIISQLDSSIFTKRISIPGSRVRIGALLFMAASYVWIITDISICLGRPDDFLSISFLAALLSLSMAFFRNSAFQNIHFGIRSVLFVTMFLYWFVGTSVFGDLIIESGLLLHMQLKSKEIFL
ncbi:hypothetical protein ACFL3M_00490 [Patescibacteria group bacterium]